MIVAIGAQNAFVLRQGIRGEHILAVVAVCTVSDVVLIAAGVGGVGRFLASTPVLMDVVRYAGAAFLIGYAVLAARRALSPGALTAAEDGGPVPQAIKDAEGTAATGGRAATDDGDATGRAHMTDEASPANGGRSALTLAPARSSTSGTSLALKTTVLTCVALTWLNPHVYLDTVALMGTFANTFGPGRWYFAAGAMIASLLWFVALGYGGRLLAPVFARPTAWRILDSAIAVIMLALGVSLAVG
nr:LysE/ArgO family amino acid transporter [Nocardia transvalensis]